MSLPEFLCGLIASYIYSFIYTKGLTALKDARPRFCFILAGIVFCFVVSLSNLIAGSMLPVMYFPAMIVSMYSSIELWFILFIVPITGNFMGVYNAVSMVKTDECDDTIAVNDIVLNATEARKEEFVHKL